MARSRRRIWPKYLLIGLAVTCLSTVHAQDMDDVMGGFDDLDEYSEAVNEATPTTNDPIGDKAWALSGSLSAAIGYNLVNHRSITNTDYAGLSKLRTRLNLSLDGKLSEHWRVSLNSIAWHDFAYALQNSDYSAQVLSTYENEFDIGDAYIQGRLSDSWDLKLGRQVIVWGFADNLRVLDVIDPLDNLEPGLADVEDLRRPIGALRLDHFFGPWQLNLVAITEQRFSRNPPFGSDYYPVTDPAGNAVDYRDIKPRDFDNTTGAAALIGHFSGWDLSFNAATLYQDQAHLDASGAASQQAAVLRHSRYQLLGFGVQVSRGSFLFKQEAAMLNNVRLTTIPAMAPPATQDTRQYHALLGMEYFGLRNSSLSIELAARKIQHFSDDLARSGYRRVSSETALRLSRDFFNEQLRLHAIAVLFNQDGKIWDSSGGAIYRISAEYELGSGLTTGAGVAIYQAGDQVPFNVAHDNDRLFGDLTWAF